jgi:hypothetical protein
MFPIAANNGSVGTSECYPCFKGSPGIGIVNLAIIPNIITLVDELRDKR